jgi:hypothetical protein
MNGGEQEVLGISNRLISFDVTWSAQRSKKLRGDTQIHGEQSPLTSLLSFFQIKKSRLKTDLTESRWDDMDWLNLAQDRDHWMAFVNSVMNLRVP